MVSKVQEQLREFHEKFGVPIGDTPAIREGGLRASLIAEEAMETIEAIRRGDLVEAVDGLCDLIYVCYGAALTFGIKNLDQFIDEVHRTNMLKEGGRTLVDGKILKADNWEPPRIAAMIAKDDPSNKVLYPTEGDNHGVVEGVPIERDSPRDLLGGISSLPPA